MGCLIAPDARKFEEATIYYLKCRKKNGGAREGGWDEANTESQERDHNPTNQQEEVDEGLFAISSDFQQQLAATLSLLSGMRREKGGELDSITTRNRRLPRCSFYAHVKCGSALSSLTSSISERGQLSSAVHLLLEPCFETRREEEGVAVGSKDKTCDGGTGDQHFVFKGLKVVHCAPATGGGPIFFSSTFQEEEEILLDLFILHSSLRTESLPQVVANEEGVILPLDGDGAWSVKTTEEALMKAASMAGDRIARKKPVMITSTSNEESYGTSSGRRRATLGADFSWHYCAEIFSLLGKRQVSRNFYHQKVFRDSWEDLPISGKSPKNGVISESPKGKSSSIFTAILSPMSSLFSES